MTRMIERWFPCTDVSDSAGAGWGSGNQERNLFTWFAARPTAQAKAAVICSLLPWPEDREEQRRLQSLVRECLGGRYAAWQQVRDEVLRSGGPDVSILDPFSGRGMIPLEAARLGITSHAFDYSPVAVLASHLLTDYPFRDWCSEPPLPFEDHDGRLHDERSRLLVDVHAVLVEIGNRWTRAVAEFCPKVADKQPLGYLWGVTLPCQECHRRFPLVGSYELRKPSTRRPQGAAGPYSDPGQSFYVASEDDGSFRVELQDGPPTRTPTLTAATDPSGRRIPGKSAVCVHCGHPHPLAMHRGLADEGHGEDALLLVVDDDDRVGRRFRLPSDVELQAISEASQALKSEPPFSPVLPARPDEGIAPGNNNIIGPSIYGARSYGDLANDRQTLALIRLCRVINDVAVELLRSGLSDDYCRALTGYAGANLVRVLKFSTRGAKMRSTLGAGLVDHIFANEGSLTFSYDYFEAGLGRAPGSWESFAEGTSNTLRNLMDGSRGVPTQVDRGSATSLPLRPNTVSAVVTDPPYDQMIAYADASDLFYAWLKRALAPTWPAFAVTSDPFGAQEKDLEIIVKRSRGLARTGHRDHRTREHYDRLIEEAFREMRRVVRDDGVVTIVFGHGEPEVWQRLLHALSRADLVMTGSWPASTEAGGQQGKANIKTTLTMACRPAPAGRVPGRKGAVESEIKAEIKRRYPEWERGGLAPADMLMAAAGPAMEVVGRYSEVRDATGEPVDIHTFLPLARAAVQEAMAVEIDHRPLETFDARTRFALWWARLYGRQFQAKSELRWQALASSMDLEVVRDLVDGDAGVALVSSSDFKGTISPDSAVIDVALALSAASAEGTAAMGEVIASSQLDADDPFLWATIQFLADRLPDADPDSVAFHRVLRARAGIGTAAENVVEAVRADRVRQDLEDRQIKLL